jgi:hypothetical protein
MLQYKKECSEVAMETVRFFLIILLELQRLLCVEGKFIGKTHADTCMIKPNQ